MSNFESLGEPVLSGETDLLGLLAKLLIMGPFTLFLLGLETNFIIERSKSSIYFKKSL